MGHKQSSHGIHHLLLRLVLLLFTAACTANPGGPTPLSQESPRDIPSALLPTIDHHLGPIVPGLRQGAIPQGLAYSKRHKKLFVSCYFTSGRPSAIAVIDQMSAKVVNTIVISEAPGIPHVGHVGGIGVDENHGWVSSEEKIYKFHLQDLLVEEENAKVEPMAVFPAETRASFCTVAKERLLVGEFALPGRYPTKQSHHRVARDGRQHYAWICIYQWDKVKQGPIGILSIPDKVQGVATTKERIFLSISYGRNNVSTLAIYRNPLQTPPHESVNLPASGTTPLWFLDGKALLGTITLPPMSEGIALVDDRLAVLFESGAQKYLRGGRGPMDHILYFDLQELTKTK